MNIVLALLGTVLYIAVLVYALSLMTRLVAAVERIAERLGPDNVVEMRPRDSR